MPDLDCGEGNGTPLQYSCLENPMDCGAWWAAVHGVMTSQTRLSNFTFSFHFHALEKELATHSSVLTWRIPGTEEPGGLPSMGSHRVGHDWSDLAAAAADLDWGGCPLSVFQIAVLEGRDRGVKAVGGENLVLRVVYIIHVICVLGALKLLVLAKM